MGQEEDQEPPLRKALRTTPVWQPMQAFLNIPDSLILLETAMRVKHTAGLNDDAFMGCHIASNILQVQTCCTTFTPTLDHVSLFTTVNKLFQISLTAPASQIRVPRHAFEDDDSTHDPTPAAHFELQLALMSLLVNHADSDGEAENVTGVPTTSHARCEVNNMFPSGSSDNNIHSDVDSSCNADALQRSKPCYPETSRERRLAAVIVMALMKSKRMSFQSCGRTLRGEKGLVTTPHGCRT